jgi:hypothetical protein
MIAAVAAVDMHTQKTMSDNHKCGSGIYTMHVGMETRKSRVDNQQQAYRNSCSIVRDDENSNRICTVIFTVVAESEFLPPALVVAPRAYEQILCSPTMML